MSNKEHLQHLRILPLGHITTFEAIPVPCAASAASTLLQSTDWNRVEQVRQLKCHARMRPRAGSSRIGLYIAVELESSEAVNEVTRPRCSEVYWFSISSAHPGVSNRPAFNINDVDLSEALDTLIACIEQAHAQHERLDE